MRFPLAILLVCLIVVPRSGVAQTPGRPSEDPRILVDVNLFGTAASLAKDREFRGRFIRFGEIGSSFATYPRPSRAALFPFLDVGASVRLTRWLEVGAAYGRVVHEDGAGLGTTIPHPTFFGAPASHTGATGEPLTRREAATHVFAAIVPVRGNRVEWRLMGGPTVFSLNADMVQEVLYVQTFDPASPQQTITIDGVTTSQARARALGFHAGTDVTFFLTKRFGIGGGVRFSDGTVTLNQEPLSELSQDVRVGGTLGFLGVRLRVGR